MFDGIGTVVVGRLKSDNEKRYQLIVLDGFFIGGGGIMPLLLFHLTEEHEFLRFDFTGIQYVDGCFCRFNRQRCGTVDGR